MFRLIIKLSVAGLLLYGAVGVGTPYWKYMQLRDAVQETATFAHTPSFSGRRLTPDQVLDRLAKKANEIGVPLERDDFQLKMDKVQTTIDVRYTAQLEYLPRQYYLHDFVIHAEGEPSRYRAAATQ